MPTSKNNSSYEELFSYEVDTNEIKLTAASEFIRTQAPSVTDLLEARSVFEKVLNLLKVGDAHDSAGTGQRVCVTLHVRSVQEPKKTRHAQEHMQKSVFIQITKL